MLNCGTCSDGESCGGAGTPNVCGGVCNAGCPNGFTCDANGVCVGGSVTNLVFNEVGYTVAGMLQVDGAPPTQSKPSYCAGGSSADIARVRFVDSKQGYDAAVEVLCTSNSRFNTRLPAGTYDVRVERGAYSDSAGVNLLPVSYQAITRLKVP